MVLSRSFYAVLCLLIAPCSAFMAQKPALARTPSVRVYAAKPTKGSIVTVNVDLRPEGDFVPDSLIDTTGKLTFVLGGGNYLPGLHDLVADMSIGDKVDGVSLDAGFGSKNPNLVATLQKADMGDQIDVSQLKVGTELYLVNGMKAVVTEVDDDSFQIDANPPLAGASYRATVELLAVDDAPVPLEYTPEGINTKYQLMTCALGCFWGGELEFMRKLGIVGTKVGYTQGDKENPEYKQVCSGTTGHTEAIQVVFDPEIVSYEDLVQLAMDRLGENKYLVNQVGNDRGTQYRHGIYYHSGAQKKAAEEVVGRFGDDCKTEVLPATKFWDAEDYHQQYLLKGGQSARKNDPTTIRCYG